MSSLLEHYKTLGVNIGAGMNDVTSSYKRLCRIYHPDINGDPESEELMKMINIAYTVLREKLRREAAFRERQAYPRTARRYPANPDISADGAAAGPVSAEEEKKAFSTLHDYFMAINTGDYKGAYDLLSSHDRMHISPESFIDWRKSVARLYPMREFDITGGKPGLTMKIGDEKTISACKYNVLVTEEDIAGERMQSGTIEKMAVLEDGMWKVYLGYSGVVELTRGFDEKFEAKRKRDIAKKWEEYYSGMHQDYNMLSSAGMRKAASREIYRQKRFGGTLTFAAISIKTGNMRGTGQDELLRSAARTITASLRETDIPAYAGDGVFAILFVELHKKNSKDILDRLSVKIRKNAGPQLGGKAGIDIEFESWSNGRQADMDSLNKVLKKFNKKL